MKLDITGIGFVASSPADQRRGLLGWVSCVVNDALLIDGLCVRRARTGRLGLSFPSRTDRHGRKHPVVRPLDHATRQHLAQEIFKAIRINLEETAP